MQHCGISKFVFRKWKEDEEKRNNVLPFFNSYGKTFRAGDIVSVLLDYGKRRIAFFVNHEFVNVASRETGLLQRKLHLAAALAYEGDQLTLLPPLQWPPQKAAISAKNDLKQT